MAARASERLRTDSPSTGSAAAASEPSSDRPWRSVLELWMRWNEAYEYVTASAFRNGPDPGQLEAMMDEMDQLRLEAISRTRQLLG